METLWQQVRNIFLDYFLICFGGSSNCTPWPCNPPPPKARERQPLQINTLDSLTAKRKTTMKTGAWRTALCTRLEGISKLLWKPPSSSHGNENCVHVMWPRVPSQVFVHVTWNQISKWRLSFCIHWQWQRQTDWGERTKTTWHTGTLWPIATQPYQKKTLY